MGRIDKENYYLDIAETVLERSTCMRRCYGAIIVNHDEIVSTGYNGAPRGRKNCADLGYCTREAMKIPCAAPFTRRPTLSSPPPGGRCWGPRFTWPAATRPQGS